MNKKTIGKILLTIGIVATVALIGWLIYCGIHNVREYNALSADIKKYVFDSATDAAFYAVGKRAGYLILSIATAIVGIVLIKKSK